MSDEPKKVKLSPDVVSALALSADEGELVSFNSVETIVKVGDKTVVVGNEEVLEGLPEETKAVSITEPILNTQPQAPVAPAATTVTPPVDQAPLAPAPAEPASGVDSSTPSNPDTGISVPSQPNGEESNATEQSTSSEPSTATADSPSSQPDTTTEPSTSPAGEQPS